MKKTLAILCALVMVLSQCVFAADIPAGGAESVTLTGEVAQTVSGAELVLSGVTAPDGKYLTLVSEGIEIPVADGVYKNATLTVTDAIHPDDGIYNGGMTNGTNTAYRTAIMIDAGALVEGQSVLAALQTGTYDGDKAAGLAIDSDSEFFNGVIINDTDYTIDGMFMTADGSGGSDFMGWGAGVAVTGTSQATVNNLVFLGAGAVRHGVYVGGELEEDGLDVTVNNSYVRVNGSLYEQSSSGAMNSCPWMLGIDPNGHARSTMADGYATVHYNNCILLSDGWGILSTDDVSKPAQWGDTSLHLIITDTVVDVTCDSSDSPSAYGTYAIGACFNQFFGCVVGNGSESELFAQNAAALSDYGVDYDYETVEYGLTYAAIVANEYAGVGFYDGTVIDTCYGVMFHKTNNVRYVEGDPDASADTVAEAGLTEVRNSTVNTYGAAFLIKACTPVIEVENTSFNPEKGVIVQLMTCDDPGMGASNFSETLYTDADEFAALVARDEAYDPYGYNLISRTLFSNSVQNMIEDVQVSFTDCNTENGTALEGDFYNSISVSTSGEGMTWFGQNLILSFDSCDIIGNCSSSSALHVEYGYYLDADGNVVEAADTAEAIANGAVTGCIDSACATLLGNLDNTPTATVNNGVWVELKNGSVWTPTDVCYLTRLLVDDSSAINGTVLVNGEEVTLEAGTLYTGEIIVTPAAAKDEGMPEAEADNGAMGGDELSDVYVIQSVDVMGAFTLENVEVSFDDLGGGVKTFAVYFDGQTITGTINMGVWTPDGTDENEVMLLQAIQAAYEAENVIGG